MRSTVLRVIFCICIQVVLSLDNIEVKYTIGALLSSDDAVNRFKELIHDVRAHVNGRKILFQPAAEVCYFTYVCMGAFICVFMDMWATFGIREFADLR